MTTYMGGQLAAPAPGSGGKFPLSVEKVIVAGYAENEGAPLTTTDGTDWVAVGANPTQIAAVAITPGGADTSGFNILARKEFPPLTMQAIMLDPQLRFRYPYIGTLGTVGNTYGITRDTDGYWKIDFTKDDKEVLYYLGPTDLSPADTAGSGQDSMVFVSFVPGIIQQL